MNETDQIVLARQGDERAWTVLVQQHQAALFHLAYLMLGDADEAADVAQDAFIRAFYALSPRFTSRRLRLIIGEMGLLVVVGGLGWATLVMRLPTTLAAQPVATADYGRALFMAKGCNSCHLLHAA